jgi:cysteine desulfurase
MTRVYLDYNATTPLRPSARAAVLAAMDVVGAASSVHGEGRAARRIIEQARSRVARLVGASEGQVIFTSGATEANNTALTPGWQSGTDRRPLDRLLTSTIEHACVLRGARFDADRTDRIAVDGEGRIDAAAWASTVSALGASGARALSSIMLANNETGVIQPVAEIAQATRAAGGFVHTDAAQAAGKIPISIGSLGVDALTLSSHKLGGPMGVGALVLATESVHLADCLVRGGGQERGWRAGTENIPAIAGFGAAAAELVDTLDREAARIRALRDRLETSLIAMPGVTIFGAGAERLPNTINLAFEGIPAETALIALDLEGIAISSGAACSSGKVASSHVLAAMGVPSEVARTALRISLGWTTTETDIAMAENGFSRVVSTLRNRMKERAA